MDGCEPLIGQGNTSVVLLRDKCMSRCHLKKPRYGFSMMLDICFFGREAMHMKLSDYLRSVTPEQRQATAAAAGTSVGYLYVLAGGSRRGSPDMALRIELATGGAVTREDMLPEFFIRQPAASDRESAA